MSQIRDFYRAIEIMVRHSALGSLTYTVDEGRSMVERRQDLLACPFRSLILCRGSGQDHIIPNPPPALCNQCELPKRRWYVLLPDLQDERWHLIE